MSVNDIKIHTYQHLEHLIRNIRFWKDKKSLENQTDMDYLLFLLLITLKIDKYADVAIYSLEGEFNQEWIDIDQPGGEYTNPHIKCVLKSTLDLVF